jgi:site-specific recombinase XerD
MGVSKPARVRVNGPLERYSEGFYADLVGQGYTAWSATKQLRLLAHLSRWLDSEGLQVAGLSEKELGRFAYARREAGYVHLHSSRAFAPLLRHFRAVGVLAEPTLISSAGAIEKVLVDFGGYLVRERCVSGGTSRYYQGVARSFLSGCGYPDEHGDGLSARDVNDFLRVQARKRGAGSLRHTVSALRCLLGFLHLRGHTAWSLAGSVPSPPGWHRPAVPRGVEPDRVARLLECCDRQTAVGRRDYAILVVLARLGLRASEVAALTLDDIDWRAGDLVVRGKADRWERLPLPVDVGQALAEHLRLEGFRGRMGGERHVFVRVRAPRGGLTNHGVCSVVHNACDRANLPRIGAHRLRHNAATAIRRAGAPLSEVAQLLRHRRLATTATYTVVDDVDREALRGIARPWPQGGAR